MTSCLDNPEDMNGINNDEEISRLSAEIALLKVELNKKTALLKKKQVPNKYQKVIQYKVLSKLVISSSEI